MKVLITGGGTGGHIYPAIAIVRKIKKEMPKADILYVGTEHGLESDIVPKEGIDFKTVRVKGFQRRISPDTFKSFIELTYGLNDARKLIKKYKPDIVIGTGGYVCGPIVFLAALNRIPTLIHEQNAFPGITNKILSNFVTKIACSFEEAKKYFSNREKISITGNPVREDILNIDKEKAYEDLGLDSSKKIVLSFGGSGGQRSLNDVMMNYILDNLENRDIQIVHVTGKRFYKSFGAKLREKGIKDMPQNIKILEYCYDLPKYMAVSSLVVTSAGAITIAELTALGIPSIIVPKKNTAENHQEYNARALEKKGASLVFLEDELKDIDFSISLDKLLKDDKTLKEMGIKSREMGITDASDRIFALIKEIMSS